MTNGCICCVGDVRTRPHPHPGEAPRAAREVRPHPGRDQRRWPIRRPVAADLLRRRRAWRARSSSTPSSRWSMRSTSARTSTTHAARPRQPGGRPDRRRRPDHPQQDRPRRRGRARRARAPRAQAQRHRADPALEPRQGRSRRDPRHRRLQRHRRPWRSRPTSSTITSTSTIPRSNRSPSPTRAAFDRARFEAYLRELAEARGDDIFRLKGIVSLAGEPRRVVLQAVHRIMDLRAGRCLGQREAREQARLHRPQGSSRSSSTRGLRGCCLRLRETGHAPTRSRRDSGAHRRHLALFRSSARLMAASETCARTPSKSGPRVASSPMREVVPTPRGRRDRARCPAGRRRSARRGAAGSGSRAPTSPASRR